MKQLKSEIQARIEELKGVLEMTDKGTAIRANVLERIGELQDEVGHAEEDMASSVIRSHATICRIKKMGEKDAYGQDPALYYSAAISAEAGEQLNGIVRGLRNGQNHELTRLAVIKELPDILIYSFVLAHVLELDLPRLVREKADIVIQRAEDGYYGGPIAANAPPKPKNPE
jgi:NTP pyrophosphatase (non-canonical NTP hydrolase)